MKKDAREEFMEKIIPEIRNAKKYFNNTDLRIMVSENYIDCEGWHKHKHIEQIIYVISGAVEVSSETSCDILVGGESITILAGERHIVLEKEPNTHILVVKYLPSGMNIIEYIKNDYIKG